MSEVVADGTNLQACEDGACEVEIKSGDVPSIKGERFTVVSVDTQDTTFVLPSGTTTSVGGAGNISTGSGTNVVILRNNGSIAMIRVS
ncbi:hypothetical protein ACOBQX_21985 [Actinokineospora sp. G85]|uniref:hypothetical protein n=1 Tax=Actinokineospora sp. G85 TaxID=3406626 RepID=UPI003C784BFB